MSSLAEFRSGRKSPGRRPAQNPESTTRRLVQILARHRGNLQHGNKLGLRNAAADLFLVGGPAAIKLLHLLRQPVSLKQDEALEQFERLLRRGRS